MTLVITAPKKADAGQLVFRPVHEVMAPEGRQRGVAPARAVDRVPGVILFPASQRLSAIFAAHLPATGVAAEERDVAALANELLQIVPHGCRPVFVVSDAEDQAI